MSFDEQTYEAMSQTRAAVGTIRQDVRDILAAMSRLEEKVAQIAPRGPSRGPVEYVKECGCKSRGHWVAESSRDGPVEVWCNVPECNCHPKGFDDPDDAV